MVDIKDFVFDKLGILDDAEDFSDRIKQVKRDFKAKATVAKRLLADMESVVNSARTPDELRRANLREVVGVVKDLRKGMQGLISEASTLERKARRDQKIWAKLEKPLSDAVKGMKTFVAKMQETTAHLVLAEREQKETLKALAKQEAKTGDKRRNPLSRRLGKIVGIVAASLLIVGAISLTVK